MWHEQQVSFGCPGWEWQQSWDSICGLSTACTNLIELATSENSTHPLCASLIAVPCQYLLLNPSPTPGQYLSISRVVGFVVRTLPHAGTSPCSDLLHILVTGGGHVIQRVCMLPMPSLLFALRKLQPTLLIQKILYLMTQQFQGIVDGHITRFQHCFETAIHIQSAHRHQLSHLDVDERHALLSPSFVLAAKLMLHRAALDGHQLLDQQPHLFSMLSTAMIFEPRPDIYMTMPVHLPNTTSDKMHMRDMVTLAAADRYLTPSALQLASAFISQCQLGAEPWSLPDRHSITLMVSRVICMFGLGWQQKQQELQRPFSPSDLHMHQPIMQQQLQLHSCLDSFDGLKVMMFLVRQLEDGRAAGSAGAAGQYQM